MSVPEEAVWVVGHDGQLVRTAVVLRQLALRHSPAITQVGHSHLHAQGQRGRHSPLHNPWALAGVHHPHWALTRASHTTPHPPIPFLGGNPTPIPHPSLGGDKWHPTSTATRHKQPPTHPRTVPPPAHPACTQSRAAHAAPKPPRRCNPLPTAAAAAMHAPGHLPRMTQWSCRQCSGWHGPGRCCCHDQAQMQSAAGL